MSDIRGMNLQDLSDEELLELHTREKVRERVAKQNLDAIVPEMRRRGGLQTSQGFFTEGYRNMMRPNITALEALAKKLGATDKELEACVKASREPAGWRFKK